MGFTKLAANGCTLALLAALLFACGKPAAPPQPTPTPEPHPEPASGVELADRLLAAISAATSLEAKFSVNYDKQLGGIDKRTTGSLELTFTRPDKYRYRAYFPSLGEWPMETLHVCDGESLMVYSSWAEEYFKEEPLPLSELSANTMAYQGIEDLLFIPVQLLIAAAPRDYLLEEVNAVHYLGRRQDKARRVDRLWLDQESADILIEIDVETGLPHRLVVDFLKIGGECAFDEEQLAQSPRLLLTFEGEFKLLTEPLAEELLVFEAPPGSVEVYSPYGADGVTTRPVMLAANELDLVGQPAASFSLPDTRGEERSLDDYRRQLVLLYFFSSTEAEWQNRVRQLSALERTAALEDLQVMLVDHAATIDRTSVDYVQRLNPAWLHLVDPARTLHQNFLIEEIDRLVLIDGSGRIAHFYNAPLRPSRDTIAAHLQLVARGQVIPLPLTGFSEAVGIGALKIAWESQAGEVRGAWAEADADTSPGMKLFYAADAIYEVDIKEGQTYHVLDYAKLGVLWRGELRGPQPSWLTYRPFFENRKLAAVNDEGELLWEYDESNVINHFVVGDVENDGRPEILMGFNARGGVQLADAGGNRLWQRENLINIANVGMLDIDGDGIKELFCTTHRGPVLIMSAKGEDLKYIDPALLTAVILPLESFGEHGPVLVCGGSGMRGEKLVLMSLDDEQLWDYAVSKDELNEINSIFTLKWDARELVAATTFGGTIVILDTKGQEVYRAEMKSLTYGALAAELNGDGRDEIVVWGKKGITCLTPADESAATGRAPNLPGESDKADER